MARAFANKYIDAVNAFLPRARSIPFGEVLLAGFAAHFLDFFRLGGTSRRRCIGLNEQVLVVLIMDLADDLVRLLDRLGTEELPVVLDFGHRGTCRAAGK